MSKVNFSDSLQIRESQNLSILGMNKVERFLHLPAFGDVVKLNGQLEADKTNVHPFIETALKIILFVIFFPVTIALALAKAVHRSSMKAELVAASKNAETEQQEIESKPFLDSQKRWFDPMTMKRLQLDDKEVPKEIAEKLTSVDCIRVEDSFWMQNKDSEEIIHLIPFVFSNIL